MAEPCSNTTLLNQHEHQQMLAERELQAGLEDQERAGIDPMVWHVEDMLGCDEFYDHVASALVDNVLVKPLLIVLMCGDEDEGLAAARQAVIAMAKLHAKRETESQAGLYISAYDSSDADPVAALQELRGYIKELST